MNITDIFYIIFSNISCFHVFLPPWLDFNTSNKIKSDERSNIITVCRLSHRMVTERCSTVASSRVGLWCQRKIRPLPLKTSSHVTGGKAQVQLIKCLNPIWLLQCQGPGIVAHYHTVMTYWDEVVYDCTFTCFLVNKLAFYIVLFACCDNAN